MPDPIKRLNYFDHQFMHVEDFTDEQSYHREMRRLHNQLLHTWGVCVGLQLSYPAGATVATVSTGTAIDGRGQQIVLTDNTNTPDISNLPGAAGHQVYVTIMYAEQQSDTSSETGTTGNRRVTEAPVIEVMTQPPSDSSMHIILGRVTVGADGRLTGQPDDGASPTIRRTAGAVGGNLEVTSLTLGSPSVDPGTWPSLRVGAPSQASLNGSLAVSGNLGVAGGVSVAGTLAVTAPSQLGRLLIGSTDMSGLTSALSVVDNTGIRQNSLYLSGGPGWSSLTYNAHHAPANDRWIFPDPSQTAVTLELDNQGGPGRLQVYSSTLANKTTFLERLAIDGESGNIALGLGAGVGNLGIGTATPAARLDVVANSTTAGGWYEAIRFSQPAHSAITHPGGGLLFGLHGTRNFMFLDIENGTFQKYLMIINAAQGFVGIGTPGTANAPLQIWGGNWDVANSEGDLKIGDDSYRLKLGIARTGAGAGDARIHAHGGTNRLLLGSAATDTLTIVGNDVGIGTTTPACALDVVANSATMGGWFEAIRLSRPEHSAITHPGGGLLFGLHGDRHFYFGDISGGTFHRYVMTIDGNTGNVGMAGGLTVSGLVPYAVSGQNANVSLALPGAAVIAAQGRLHLACDELLYLLPKTGVVVGKEWGGTGNLTVEGTLSAAGGVAQEDWHPVNFMNGWRNFAADWAAAAYRKDALGVVHVRGLITGGTTGFTNGVAFILPVGYRPSARMMFVSICGEGWGLTRIDVDAAGNAWVGQTETPGSIGNAWVALTTVNFRADQ